MAVYTPLTNALVADFLDRFDIGSLHALEGIAEGVENTNYRLTTDQGPFILTLFEKRVDRNDLPFFMDAMAHFDRHAIRCPRPVADRSGAVILTLADKPAAITTFLAGRPITDATPQALHDLGRVSAQMHQAGLSFRDARANPLSLAGWQALAEATAPSADSLAPGLRAFIAHEIDWLRARWPTSPLPAGLVHADLFPDNVFFESKQVSGVIDFYFSCTDFLSYDLAITLNAWAAGDDAHARALLAGYQSVRPLRAEEIAALPVFLRGAALRFLLTRLYDWINQVDGALVAVKDPLAYRDIISQHRARSTWINALIAGE